MAAPAAASARGSFARRYHLGWYLRQVVLLLWAAVVLFPLFWMVSTSFKDVGEWVAWPPHWLPHRPTLQNYAQILAWTPAGGNQGAEALHAFTIWKAFGDSLLLATGSALASLGLGTFLAYAMSRFNVGGRNFRYLVLTIRMVPPIVIAIPLLMYYAVLLPHASQTLLGVRWSLFDTYLGLGLLYTATALPFVIWMMLNFIDAVPRTLEQAARLMGAGRLYTLRRVVLPLVASGMAVTFVFIFILNWSEFLLALTLTQPRVSTLPVLLNKFQGAVEGRLYGPQAAIGTLMTLPVLLLGMRIQKHLITGFSFGMLRK